MDSNQKNFGKTYQSAMDEWAAQRDFLERSRNRLLHPPYDSPLPFRIFGYLLRLAVLLVIPAVVFLLILRKHGKSEEFSEMLQEEAGRYLAASELTAIGAGWSAGGELKFQTIRATGSADSFFNRLEAKNVTGHIPIPRVFRKAWALDRVKLGELHVELRSGAAGTATRALQEEDILAPAQRSPRTGMLLEPRGMRQPVVLQAGYGVNPDFTQLTIREFDATLATITWGTSPSTRGAIQNAQTNLARNAGGDWVMRARNGHFTLGWLREVGLENLSVVIGKDDAQVNTLKLRAPGGGTVDIKGRVILGDVPLIEGRAEISDTSIQPFLPAGIGDYFEARATGTIQLSGSVNRATGVQTDTDFTFSEGRVRAVPILRSLQVLTGVDEFYNLPVRSGRVRVIHGGSESHGGGIVLTVRELDLDCGPLVRITGDFRYERRIVNVLNPEGVMQASEEDVISGAIRVGVSDEAAAKIQPEIAEKYLSPSDGGFRWIEIPVKTDAHGFSKEIADELLIENRKYRP